MNENKSSFWSSQPVPQSTKQLLECSAEKPITDLSINIQTNPLSLPNNFAWCLLDLTTTDNLDDLYYLLRDHYVSDKDEKIRFNYSQDFLKWALYCPNYKAEWFVGVRSTIGKKPLVAFISAIPVTILVNHQPHNMAEINFLCVHHKLRSYRLAPVLIKEITRRINICGIFQAVYTAGVTLPTPIATCQYYHRSLNVKKLVDIGFHHLNKGITLTQLIKLYKLPRETYTIGLRPLQKKDCTQACNLLNTHLKKFKLHMHFNIVEFEYWFCSRPTVIESYVVENQQTNQITDLVSFYILPSTIIGDCKYDILSTAYLWYTVSTVTPLVQLIKDVLIIAANMDIDIFNCLNTHHNDSFITELKFSAGSGNLNYYLYNWLTSAMSPNEIGLTML